MGNEFIMHILLIKCMLSKSIKRNLACVFIKMYNVGMNQIVLFTFKQESQMCFLFTGYTC